MKQTFVLAFVSLWLFGCANTNTDSNLGFNCESAQKAYTTYLALSQSGVYTPSEDEVKYAKMAGLFLSVSCGWTPPPATRSVRAAIPTEDSRGILILVPPSE